MFELAAAIVIGLLAWRCINRPHARFGARRIVRWCVLGVLVSLLAVCVHVLHAALLVDSEWLMLLVIGFVLLLIAKSWLTERRWLGALRKYGWPKAIAEIMARDGARWETGFKLKHWRSPSKEESIAWRRNWEKQHDAEMLKPEIITFLATQCRAQGRLDLAKLHEADLEWLLEFERTRHRPPNKVEVAAWVERCKAGEAQEIARAFQADGIPEPRAAAAAFMKWAEIFEQDGREPTQAELAGWFARWTEQRGTESSSQSTQRVPPPSGLPQVSRDDFAEMVGDYLEAMGVPQPEAATEAFMDWSDAFERSNGRMVGKAEFDGWLAAWREMHGAAPPSTQEQGARSER
jgi:hypothetical protein